MQIYITNETLKFSISMIHGKVINNIINANTHYPTRFVRNLM